MQTPNASAHSTPGARPFVPKPARGLPRFVGLVASGLRSLLAFARRRFLLLSAMATLGVLTIALLSHLVVRDTRTQFYTTASVPSRDVAVVFGAGVRPDGTLAAALEDRVVTAIDLYRAGKVRKLLMSGDNSIVGYDEPTAMKRYAVEQGVPAADVALDYAGFHTYDTCYRARAIFGVTGAVLVTQRYHLARALFTCKGLGVDVVGVPADRQRYRRYTWYLTREQISRARAFLQVKLFKPRPKFLGKQEPIL